MPTPLATSLTPILNAVSAQLTAVTGIPANLIRLVARGTTPRFQADQDILLRAGQVTWNRGFDAGSGRVCPILRRPLLVHLRTRFNADPSDADDSRLTDPAYGHIPFEESVINALAWFIPQDANQNWLVQEPMHPLDYPPEELQTAEAADWIESNLAFQLTYQLPVPTTGSGY